MNKKHTTMVVLDFALAVAIVILVEGYLGSTSALAVATFVMFGHRLRALEARNKASDRVTVSVIVKPDVMSAVAYGDQDPKALVEAMEKIKVEFDKHINVTNTPPPQAPPKLRACEACRGPGPTLWDERDSRYKCEGCRESYKEIGEKTRLPATCYECDFIDPLSGGEYACGLLSEDYLKGGKVCVVHRDGEFASAPPENCPLRKVEEGETR